ncbi:AAC(3) family N-acetyltransferase [Cryptosporangium aurantiacum]|uniref:Aminoglycoside N(3)-acetyltransferase n=1 Tax=Cryptosporangium aurantiacum TaxID=134849 RepID=A0A1M7L3N8_9ACTN|nr:AAC(3) family N-acetyltransferase [Cryptosporangium aurantiacum]SHM71913.1 aminoglycoside 3-N-acetyltransferase [Cryptosporangium aurantiacum]
MARVPGGLDVADLVVDLGRLDVSGAPGILVHSSSKQLRHGPATLFSALLGSAGREATVVVPTHTTSNSLSSRVFLAATAGLDRADVERHIDALPGFDAATTPSDEMGAFAEYVRQRPDAVRSRHPQTSFAAVGPRAAAWMAVHDLDCHLGERSPLAALYDADAHVLLVGVGLDRCTAFHLAEYRVRTPAPLRPYHCFVRAGGRRHARRFADIELHDHDFAVLGREFGREPTVTHGTVGAARAAAFPLRAAVDFAVEWMNTHRPSAGRPPTEVAG